MQARRQGGFHVAGNPPFVKNGTGLIRKYNILPGIRNVLRFIHEFISRFMGTLHTFMTRL